MPDPLPPLSPRSMEDIFKSSPVEMTEDELTAFIAHCREIRAKVVSQESLGKRRLGAKAPARAATSTISLNDLF